MASHDTHKTGIAGRQRTLELKQRRSEKYSRTTINVGGYARKQREMDK